MILGMILAAVQDRAALERWRESLELDLPAEVVEAGVPRIAAGGALARDGEAIALVARARFAAGDEVGARQLLAIAQPEAASAVFVELARARLAIEGDELDRALRILIAPTGAEPRVRFPSIPEGWLLPGRALVRAGRGEEAAPLLEKFVALAPFDVEAPAAWHMLTQIAIGRRDLARAETLRAKAAESARWQGYYRTRRLQIREHPAEPLPRLGLAELLLAANEPARARRACNDLLAIAPGFCRGFEALGTAERRLGNTAAAKPALERALECDPTLAKACLELARLLDETGEKDAAAARYRRYVELGGREPLSTAR